MTVMFGLKGTELSTFKAQSIACCEFDIFNLKKVEGLDYLIKYCKNLIFNEYSPQIMTDSFYSLNQDILLQQKNIPSHILYLFPPFSEFGRTNFTQYLEAWSSDGENALVRAYWKILTSEWQRFKNDYKSIEEKLYYLRSAAFDKFNTVQYANNLIYLMGIKKAAKLPVEEFLEKLEIRLNRAGLSNNHLVGLSICTMSSGKWELLGLKRSDALEVIRDYCEQIGLHSDSEEAAKSVFYSSQNALMAFRKDDFYTIQKEPPFSSFGYNNLVEFLNVYKSGGEEALKETFNKIFSEGWENRVQDQPIIKILSGDGKTEETAVRFSTDEMPKRIRAESWFVHYQFGLQDKDWEKGLHFSTITNHSLWVVMLPDGNSENVFFDKSTTI